MMVNNSKVLYTLELDLVKGSVGKSLVVRPFSMGSGLSFEFMS